MSNIFSTLFGPSELYSKIVREYLLRRSIQIKRISKIKYNLRGSTEVEFINAGTSIYLDFEKNIITLGNSLIYYVGCKHFSITESYQKSNELSMILSDDEIPNRFFDFSISGNSITLKCRKEDITLELVGIGGWIFENGL